MRKLKGYSYAAMSSAGNRTSRTTKKSHEVNAKTIQNELFVLCRRSSRRPTWRNKNTRKEGPKVSCLLPPTGTETQGKKTCVSVSRHPRPAAMIATLRRRPAARCVVVQQPDGVVDGEEDLGAALSGQCLPGGAPTLARRAACTGMAESVVVASYS